MVRCATTFPTVHPSHNEPFGLAVGEASAAGLPVVAYAEGATPEIVKDAGEAVKDVGDAVVDTGEAVVDTVTDAAKDIAN